MRGVSANFQSNPYEFWQQRSRVLDSYTNSAEVVASKSFDLEQLYGRCRQELILMSNIPLDYWYRLIFHD